MQDTDAAIAWSKERLIDGGAFIMDDFVGPNRFQWSELNLEFASKVRELLPDSLLCHPTDPSRQLTRKMAPPNIDQLIARDPTEAADSESILPSLMKHFPNADVVLTGGCIFDLALHDAIGNFDDMEDSPLLKSLLLLDEALCHLGETHYAVAIALKDDAHELGRRSA
jgi:hypothetical protein